MDLIEKGDEDSFVILDNPISLIAENATEAESVNETISESGNQLITSTNLLHNEAIMSNSDTATAGNLTASVMCFNDKIMALPIKTEVNETLLATAQTEIADANAVATTVADANAVATTIDTKVDTVQSSTETPIDNIQNDETILNTSEAVVIDKLLTNSVNSVNSFEKVTKTDQANSLNSPIRSTVNDSGKLIASNDLAASYIMGEVNADVLKTNIYSQYSSCSSMAACAEDAWKIQKLSQDCFTLKESLEKVTARLAKIVERVLEWKEEMQVKENEYKQQIENFQQQIETQRNENLELNCKIKKLDEQFKEQQSNMNNHISAMQTEIAQEKKQSQSFKEELSAVVAKNFELQDMQARYIDEINCLKVNLTAADELIKQNHANINVLQVKNVETINTVTNNETENKCLREDLTLLRHQLEIYRNDFETERNERQNLAGERDQLLRDLRTLQRKNQELIEHAQVQFQDYEQRRQATPTVQPVVENNQTKERKEEKSPPKTFSCPVCVKNFQSLIILQEHVNTCLDQT